MKRGYEMGYQVMDHYDIVWGLIIYGMGNEYGGVDTPTAAKVSECSKLFHQISISSDMARCYWKGNVIKHYNCFYEEDTLKADKSFRELFFSYSHKMMIVLGKCEKFKTYNEVYKLLSPLKKYLSEPFANSHAQFLLANCYSCANMGYNFTNVENSVKFFHLSADQGFLSAEEDLGIIYEYGKLNQLRDLNLAFKYYKLAADHRILDDYKKLDVKPAIDIGISQIFSLKSASVHFKDVQRGYISCNRKFLFTAARCHEEGIGTMIDLKKAVKYYRVVPNAMYFFKNRIIFRVANFFEEGIGTQKNLSEAIKYYKVCIKNQTPDNSI